MAGEKFAITPEQIQELQEATLMDDDFMREFFRENIPGVQKVLQIIMNKPDLIVKSVSVQHNLPGFGEFHGVRFDVYAIDSEGRQYDIEFQNDSDGADPHRADFNSAMMTVSTLKKGEDYSILAERERVVIFITKTDVLKGGLPLYTVKRVISETGKPFNDGVLILYVNTSLKDTATALGKLIHDFRCRNTKEWYYADMAEHAEEVRKENVYMKSWQARAEEVRADERAVTYENVALSLIRLGKNALEDIAKCCHLTLERVQELAATVKS